jgi:hypothetical protein
MRDWHCGQMRPSYLFGAIEARTLLYNTGFHLEQSPKAQGVVVAVVKGTTRYILLYLRTAIALQVLVR